MRWEEIWDASLRIRNYFLHASIPDEIASQITEVVEQNFFEKPMAVRSSASDEDASHTSFAGLHESYLNIRGGEQVLEHIKKLWASLWNDRALLYRQEPGLDVSSSAMAVVVQEMITGESSGIVFSQHPEHASQMIIESVYGLNQGLVDGEVEPDRWILTRKDGAIVSYSPPSTNRQAVYSFP
jgi:phosphoenolpyruvate synthase/pyruvate phosphate dikinase